MARTADPKIDRAIFQATIELMAVHGYDAVTIQAVAERAGTARTTVYRRFGGVEPLVAAAVEALLPLEMSPDSADPLSAWRSVVESLRAALFDTPVGLRLLAALVVAESAHPELLPMWRVKVVAPRVEMLARHFGWSLEEARQLGELALGGLIAAHVSRGHVDEATALDLANLLWRLAPSRT